jgi:hypothetical protein
VPDDEAADDDIDNIGPHSIDPMPLDSLRPGRGFAQVFVPSASTTLEEEDAANETIPPPALWAMKYRRHFRFGRRDDDYFRVILGDDVDPLYVLDDGVNHRMICREVGTGDEGLTYYLTGRITLGTYEAFADDAGDVADIFSEAKDLSLCSVYEASDAVSNVVLVEDYGGVGDVPTDYLPGHPQIRFSDEPGGGF